ncbi:MAG TPA: hypothetical protein VKT77_04885, partial [Chthonomonadaceae bacterium]|nr:hypothetical protein [Chthonomonadaceae bacterium]
LRTMAAVGPAVRSGSVPQVSQRRCATARACQAAAAPEWQPISDGILKSLTDAGKKPSWPGGTAGVAVDRRGVVRLIVPDQGIWTSTNGGVTFARDTAGVIGGRCETGYAINLDPAGGRLACFMLDGRSGMTLDGGRTWQPFEPHGRGWDYGAVDWSVPRPQSLLAVHHESGGELHASADGGKSWKLLGEDFTAVGIFDFTAFVASRGDGILRSTDGGATWSRVSDRTPTGRVLCVFKGVGYWVSKEGLLVSRDRGQTWQAQGGPIEAAWGPFFGRTERQIVVVARRDHVAGLWRSEDGGATWTLAAPFPTWPKESPPDWTPAKQWAAGWFTNFGWDPASDAYYASRMGHPTLKYEVSHPQ